MKTTWNLFLNAFFISCKHSGRRLLCLLSVLLFCGALLGAFFIAPRPQEPHPKARVGLINLDENPLSVGMMNTLLEGENLSELVEVVMLTSDGPGRENCTAVITVPPGFLESILTGENLSPILEVNLESPLEAMWVRQMALAGTRALSSAQLGVYAVLAGASYGLDMDAREYQLLIADINLKLLESFFNRLSLLEETRLSASGALTLPQYYAAAMAAALLFCYGFLFYPSLENLRRFSRTSGQGGWTLFLAGTLHVLLLEALITLPIYLLTADDPFPWMAWVLQSLLAGGTALFCSQLFPTRASCAAASILLTLGQALCGGLLVPLALLPTGFSVAAPLLPLWQGMHLFGVAFGERPAFLWPAVLSLLLILGSSLLWLRKRRATQ